MGPFSGLLFAQAGADVVKVEPTRGDWTRTSSGKVGGRSQGILFPALNRGKQSVAMDLNRPETRAPFRALIESADLLIAGTELEHAGVSSGQIAEWSDSIVQCYAHPFGKSGPYVGYEAEAIQLLALGGLMKITGEPGREPLQIPGRHPDYIGGLHLYAAAAASLLRRARFPETGGEVVDVSAFEAVAASAEMVCTIYTFTGAIRSRFYGRQPWGIQGEVLECRDGYIAVHPGAMDTLALLIDRADLMEDRLFTDGIYRLEHASEFLSLLRPFLELRTRAEIINECEALRVPFGAVLDVSDLLVDEQLNEREYFTTTDFRGDSVRLPGLAYRGDGCKDSADWPLLGEHTKQVFQRVVGMNSRQVDALRSVGAAR